VEIKLHSCYTRWAMSDTFFADISNFQPSVNLPLYRETNAKISEQVNWGTQITDPNGRMAEIRSLNFTVVLWYMGLMPNQDIAAQVATFVSTLGPLLPGEAVVIDWESTGNLQPPTVTQRDQAAQLIAQHYGFNVKWVGVYGPASLLQQHPTLGWQWVASYETTEPTIPHVMWQFTNGQYHSNPYGPINFPGIGYCDGSVFHGTDAQLAALVCPPGAPAPTPSPTPTPPPPTGTPFPLTGDPTTMIVPFRCTTDASGHTEVGIPLPAGCTQVVSASVQLMSVYHDGKTWDSLAVAQPTVGSTTNDVVVYGLPNHTYTGFALCS